MKVLKRQFSISKQILATERIGIGIVARIDPLYYLCSQSSNPACDDVIVQMLKQNNSKSLKMMMMMMLFIQERSRHHKISSSYRKTHSDISNHVRINLYY